jgi:hypothetical protein
MLSTCKIVFVTLFCVLFLYQRNGFAQNRDSIIYLTPDIVNNKIAEFLKASTRTGSVYASLHHNNDTTYILISTYDKTFEKLAYLIRNSNRYIKISSTYPIPVLLQEDAVMSISLKRPKNKGTEYESLETTLIIASGFLVEYKGIYLNASLIKAEYFQY